MNLQNPSIFQEPFLRQQIFWAKIQDREIDELADQMRLRHLEQHWDQGQELPECHEHGIL